MQVVTIDDKKLGKLLRKKVALFDFAKFNKTELRRLIKDMREIMRRAQGIGLSANQVGLDLNFFVAEVNKKFYAIFNPKVEKISDGTDKLEEGCLSVPDTFGHIARSRKITLSGFDLNGKKIKIKSWGLLARVFQHEVDHLNGELFLDKATDIHKITT